MSVVSFEEFISRRAASDLNKSEYARLALVFNESQDFINKLMQNDVDNFCISIDVGGREYILTLDYRGGGDTHA